MGKAVVYLLYAALESPTIYAKLAPPTGPSIVSDRYSSDANLLATFQSGA